MKTRNMDLPSVRNLLVNIVRGNAVLVDKNGQSRGGVFGTKISIIDAEGWELMEDNDNLTVDDVLPDHSIQEIDICDLLDHHLKSVGVNKFFQQFPKPKKKEVA